MKLLNFVAVQFQLISLLIWCFCDGTPHHAKHRGDSASNPLDTTNSLFAYVVFFRARQQIYRQSESPVSV